MEKGIILGSSKDFGNTIAFDNTERNIYAKRTGYLPKDISKSSVDSAIWFLLAFYSKMWDERDKLRKKL